MTAARSRWMLLSMAAALLALHGCAAPGTPAKTQESAGDSAESQATAPGTAGAAGTPEAGRELPGYEPADCSPARFADLLRQAAGGTAIDCGTMQWAVDRDPAALCASAAELQGLPFFVRVRGTPGAHRGLWGYAQVRDGIRYRLRYDPAPCRRPGCDAAIIWERCVDEPPGGARGARADATSGGSRGRPSHNHGRGSTTRDICRFQTERRWVCGGMFPFVEADHVVAYGMRSEHDRVPEYATTPAAEGAVAEPEPIINGEGTLSANAILPGVRLRRDQVERVDRLLNDPDSYGGTPTSCFCPNVGIVYYDADGRVAAHASVSTVDGRVRVEPEGPIDFGFRDRADLSEAELGTMEELPARIDGLSSEAVKEWIAICRQLGLGNCDPRE